MRPFPNKHVGIGVDSGLPDFRGNDGFWEVYPPLKKMGVSFYDMANPSWFRTCVITSLI